MGFTIFAALFGFESQPSGARCVRRFCVNREAVGLHRTRTPSPKMYFDSVLHSSLTAFAQRRSGPAWKSPIKGIPSAAAIVVPNGYDLISTKEAITNVMVSPTHPTTKFETGEPPKTFGDVSRVIPFTR